MHKLGLIMSVVLLLALAMPNVSAGGTSFSKSYNFTDYTNNKAYEGATNDTTTEIDDPYSDLTSIEDTFQEYVTPTKTPAVFAYTRFEFKINESAGSIGEINITWIGKGVHDDHAYPDGYNLYVYNATNGSWAQEKSYSTDDTKQTEYIVYTSGFSDYINTSGYLKVLARSNSSAASNKVVDIETDYIDVNVTYSKIWNVSTDKFTYKNGETISATWDNEGGFGSGEDYINVEYWDYTNGTRFNLTSHATSETSSTSSPLTDNEVGHEIDVYVYTTSSATDGNSTAITQGDPWPQASINAVVEWLSYNDEARTVEDNDFTADEDYVYMSGTGFDTPTYRVAYYDGGTDHSGANGTKVQTTTYDIVPSGILNKSQFQFLGSGAEYGTWHAVVYKTTDDMPNSYNLVDTGATNYTCADDFTVQEPAIPEFPAVIAAIAVCMLCAVAYMVMRRNKYGKE